MGMEKTNGSTEGLNSATKINGFPTTAACHYSSGFRQR